MKLAGFIFALSMLVVLDLMIALAASLYSGRSAAILVVLFFACMAVAVWRRWDGALFALHTLAIAGLLMRGVLVTGGEVTPSLLRSLVLLAVTNGLVYAVVRLRSSG